MGPAEIHAGESLIRRRYARIGFAVLAATLVCGAALAWLGYAFGSAQARRAVEASASEALALQSETLSGVLEKYRLLPPLLARRDDIIALFAPPHDGEARAAARHVAFEIAGYSGAKDVAFADATGRIFASARGIFDNSRLNENALLDAARQGRLGRETRSDDNERAYVFAASVRRGGALVGVIAVYVRIDRIEQTWSLSANPIAVADAGGLVFISNRTQWNQRRLFGPAGGDAVLSGDPDGDGVVAETGEPGLGYISARRDLPLMGWTLHVLADRAPVVAAGRTASLVVVLAALLAGSLSFFLVKRREAFALRQARAEAEAHRLEHLVQERTADLTQANAALAHEVRERTEAEAQLRKTQNELIQAAKLAALGQMSATLSHEYNQPLAAIRTYADNATALLQRGRAESVREALTRISGLVDRMSELSRTLLSFARKPGTEIGDVALAPVLEEALMLVGPRARNAGIEIRREAIVPDLAVRGGKLRLTQVVVNLLNNALDALCGIGSQGRPDAPLVTIGARRLGERVALTVEDNGPGIPDALREQVFEPFFSTKGVGEGVGIGLSIVYNIVREFGGAVHVSAVPGGGARFTVLLSAAAAPPQTLAKAS
ncbi:sensor histidine kinase [Nitratireductor alexandrii]|uniref:sensor histidine kinase n=1 Tax=Nitratireductor alexandrii TaxID=2448161 RepID=UPI000FD7A5AB|nr:ATP-binding protein [Nitratireductor alexandrii]